MERALLPVKEVAQMLSVSDDTILNMIAQGTFTPITSAGKRGRGHKILLRVEEIKLFVEGGRQAVLDARKRRDVGKVDRRRRPRKPKR